uniref:Uncharacterized protein n=1 Tax=Aegilops tauschii subsp. strangulata TaxID=200361 RepID=A0A453NRT1_AEGTS
TTERIPPLPHHSHPDPKEKKFHSHPTKLSLSPTSPPPELTHLPHDLLAAASTHTGRFRRAPASRNTPPSTPSSAPPSPPPRSVPQGLHPCLEAARGKAAAERQTARRSSTRLFHPTAAESSVRAVSLTEKRSSTAARTTRERRWWLRTRRVYRSLPQALSGRKAFPMTKKAVRLILSCSLAAVRILSCFRTSDLQSSRYPSV